MAICKNCGSNNAEGVTYCAYCGAPVETITYPQPEYQQPAYQQGYPQQPGYGYPQQPSYGQPVPKVPGKGLGIAALVLGIVSLVFFCIPYLTGVTSVIGIILGAVGLSQAKAAGMKNGLAVAGIVCSSIGLVLMILLWLVLPGALAALVSGAMDSYYYYGY